MKIETTVTFMTAPALPAGPKSFAIADTYRRRLSVAGPRQSFIAADPHVSRDTSPGSKMRRDRQWKSPLHF